MKKSASNQSAFTLVEIMIVVAIIALLAAIAVPNFLRARERSQATAVINEARMLDGAINQWAIERSKGKGDAIVGADVAEHIKAGTFATNVIAGAPATSAVVGTVSHNFVNVGDSPQVTITGIVAAFTPSVILGKDGTTPNGFFSESGFGTAP